MVVFKIGQLGTGWAVFRIDGTSLVRVDGPYCTRSQAMLRQCVLEEREKLVRQAGGTAAPALDPS